MEVSIILVVIALPVVSLLTCCLAMLERIEKHLRELHVGALGRLDGRTPEDMKIRRHELGLDDGYPHRQHWHALTAVAGTAFVLWLAYGLKPW
jgi:hypothetical protein